jgi:hypothetical protein
MHIYEIVYEREMKKLTMYKTVLCFRPKDDATTQTTHFDENLMHELPTVLTKHWF